MKTTFITGGQSTGKSTKALEMALIDPSPRVMIATAQAFDAEMEEKIRRHREERQDRFITLEEPIDLPSAFEKALALRPRVIVVDCLTMWVSNLLLAERTKDIPRFTERYLELLRLHSEQTELCHTLIVSNEVGFGIIPANALSRQYVVLLGSVNKAVANICDRVLLMVSGLPLAVKGAL
ncbi:MAG TPA: bifunctional adenosylcobinamide kinase/adenosylcobinamide-phosphate guanylyltransferase [Thermotogota bacterium]|jgi:adenosylcobinamide kinase/adenosylcobinamide-phosphate guanylyltransferase|nr:bifunctional adenosylcobinamide kinase/adenosylcobinamide-phosphate guanylyltransferase [Thermotogota bacterium]HPH11372.1 bifunctional adenosylcobinamide kinase/adenosylcobinamide-phosphate guanylyltransferase [Thermotogota bacterium]